VGPIATPAPITRFEPMSTTWVSLDTGWVLGLGPCSDGGCPRLLRTDDRGQTWRLVSGTPLPNAGATDGVRDVRFANASDGWAFNPGLWATHDGGLTWTEQALPGVARFSVSALEVTGGLVHVAAIGWDAGLFPLAIYTGTIPTDAWSKTGVRLSVGAGPIPQTRLVATHGSAWLLQVNRTLIGAARFVSDAWQAWQTPCAGTGGAAMAATSATDIAVLCDEPTTYGAAAAVHLYLSGDGGRSFQRAGPKWPTVIVGALGMPRPGLLVVSGQAAGAPVLELTADYGGTFKTVYDQPGGVFATYLGFTSATQGVALVHQGDESVMLQTLDAGYSWTQTNFPAL
jgi:hypothetical protein